MRTFVQGESADGVGWSERPALSIRRRPCRCAPGIREPLVSPDRTCVRVLILLVVVESGLTLMLRAIGCGNEAGCLAGDPHLKAHTVRAERVAILLHTR